MSTVPGRQYGVFVTIAVAAIGAAVAGFILFASGKASDVALTTADFVPAEAGLYVAVNTDLSSGQWVAMFDLAERLGRENPRDELEELAEDEDFDWDDDVVPFLGGNAAIFVTSVGFEDGAFDGAVIARCKDAKAALKVIFDEADEVPNEDTYEGHTYYYWSGDDGPWVAVVDDHIVVASREPTLFDALDAHDGRTRSLADTQDFKSLRDELTKNFLSFAYINAEALSGEFFDDEIFRNALDEAGTGDLAFKPMAMVIGAKDEGFEFHMASLGDPGPVAAMIAPRVSRFQRMVPAESAIFVSTSGLAQAFEEVVNEARDEIDDALAQQSPFTSLDDLLTEAGQPLGLGSIEEIIELFSGETALAAWFPDGELASAEGVLLAQVEDASHARDVMDSIVDATGGETDTEMVGDVEMVITGTTAYAVGPDYLLIGSEDGVRAILKRHSPSLASMKEYQSAMDQLDTQLGSFAYFNLSILLRLSDADVPEEFADARRVLDGLVINEVSERGVVRVSAAVAVGK